MADIVACGARRDIGGKAHRGIEFGVDTDWRSRLIDL
jgi:hypothetical protein